MKNRLKRSKKVTRNGRGYMPRWGSLDDKRTHLNRLASRNTARSSRAKTLKYKEYLMKTIITTNPSTPTGYELRVVHDDGTIDVTPIVKTALEKKTGINWLVLPENPTNRKLLNPARMTDRTELELSYKESKTFGPRDPNATPKTTTSKWAEYLTEDEKKVYEELMAKAQRRMKADQLKAQIAALEAQLAEAQA